jgi:hypothetical protein
MIIVFLTPVLMLTDYFLTLVGKKYRERIPYFQSETYELNPEFRNAIDRGEKINYRHLTYTVILTLASYAIYKNGDSNFLEAFTGLIITTYGVVNARHIGNILLFRFTIKNAGEIKGVIHTSHLYNLKNSLFQTVGLATVFLLLALLKPIPLLFGALASQVAFVIHQLLWIDKHCNARTTTGTSWTNDKPTVQVVNKAESFPQ